MKPAMSRGSKSKPLFRAGRMALFFAAACLLACGNPDACGDEPGCSTSGKKQSGYMSLKSCSTIAADRFLEAAYDAYCLPRPECKRRHRPGEKFALRSTCEDYTLREVFDLPGIPYLVGALANGRVQYHGEKACKCLKAIYGSCRDEVFMIADLACQQIFTGKVGGGEPCKYDMECSGGFCRPYTLQSSHNCPGRCNNAAELDETCFANKKCAVGLECHEEACVPATRGKEGERCGALGCQAGLFCDWGQNKTCAARIKPGEACNQGDDMCAQDHYCAPVPDVTRVGFQCALYYQGDQSCHKDAGFAETCAAGYTCLGTCMARVGIGEACQNSPQCPHDARCDEVCKLVPAKGESCVPGKESTGGYVCQPPFVCDTDTRACVAKPDEGSKCIEDTCKKGLDCKAGICTVGPKQGQPCSNIGKKCADDHVCIQGTCELEVCK